MPWILGADEAGYGPNLGPLVISATLWRVPEAPQTCDLYARLAEAVCDSPAAAQGRLPLADSKALYPSSKGLAHLESGVHTALALLGSAAKSWQSLWPLLCEAAPAHLQALPWYAQFDGRLPQQADDATIQAHTVQLRRCLAAQNIELRAVRSAVLFPAQLNAAIDRYGTKGAALSRATLELVAGLMREFDCTQEPFMALCDKHGGRNKYASLLHDFFPDTFVEVRGESTAESVYRWGPRGARTEFVFRARGERFLPTALASMTCKYLRELALQAENAFWRAHVPGLKPTAGYPEDAARFKREIAAAQARLGIADDLLWRKR